uniref:L-dopachrome isomerase n=1 Tax=Ixodes ricinus TaxID=34613 RepID=A0A6B0UTX0_IXORI
MPTFTINTNIPAGKVPDDFLQTTAELVARSLGKPLSKQYMQAHWTAGCKSGSGALLYPNFRYVVVHISTDQKMSFGGSTEPCAIANLYSIGCLGDAENKKHSAALFKHVQKTLGIKGDRMYINFFDMPATDVGYNGKTFG